jgi:ABC-2 type transport system ATP-binding protein
MADEIGIMHQGRLVAVGALDELRRQARSSATLEQVFLSLTSSKTNKDDGI